MRPRARRRTPTSHRSRRRSSTGASTAPTTFAIATCMLVRARSIPSHASSSMNRYAASASSAPARIPTAIGSATLAPGRTGDPEERAGERRNADPGQRRDGDVCRRRASRQQSEVVHDHRDSERHRSGQRAAPRMARHRTRREGRDEPGARGVREPDDDRQPRAVAEQAEEAEQQPERRRHRHVANHRGPFSVRCCREEAYRTLNGEVSPSADTFGYSRALMYPSGNTS